MEDYNKNDQDRRRPSNRLFLIHGIFLCLAAFIVYKIVYLQFIWEPDPKYVAYFQPKKDKNEIDPQRGSIIDHNGRLLAMSTPMYNIFMDCCILSANSP